MVLVVLVGVAAPVHAEPPAAPPAAPRTAATSAAAPAPVAPPRGRHVQPRRAAQPADDRVLPIAIGVNAPWGWGDRRFGLSAYLGLAAHSAVRLNVAWYDSSTSFGDFVSLSAGGDAPSRTGRIGDYGVAWVWYPRRLWDGFTLELGALRRDRATRVALEDDPVIKTASSTYAARAMIGWSWWILRRTYVAVAVGLSAGHESGTERSIPEWPSSEMATTRTISRTQIDGETYLRVGFAFGE